MIGTILDIVIAFLLLTTVIYCIKLSRKITVIHQGKEELNQFIEEFNNAIVKAEENISELKTLGSDTEEQLQDNIQKARYIANDLSFLMDKGEKISSNLEHNLTMSKTITREFNLNRSRLTKNDKRQISTEKNAIDTRKKAEEEKRKHKKAQEIEKILQFNAEQKSNNMDSRQIGLNSNQNDIKKQLESVQAESTQIPTPTMTDGKRRALDEVLEQIASKKSRQRYNNNKVANVTDNESSPKLTQESISNKAGLGNINKKPAPNKLTSGGSVMFDKRRLSEVLKTVQDSE